MSRRGWLVCWLGLLLGGPLAAQEPTYDRLRFYTQWNESYLYFAAKCEDVQVVGRSTKPNQPVWNDDDVELLLVTGKDRPEKLTDQCHWLALSAAGGFSFRRGDARGDGAWVPNELELLANRFRAAVNVRGTLNDAADADLGWEIEAALPWRALGLEQAPEPGAVWGFNLVRHLRGETDARYSYRLSGRDPKTQNQPGAWGQLIFRGGNGAAWLEPGDVTAVVCARAPAPAAGQTRPLIDGNVEEGEWPALFRGDAQMRREVLVRVPPEPYPPADETPHPLPPGCDYPVTTAPARPAKPFYSGERLVLATYALDYQDDPRQPGTPVLGVRRADGASALGVQPLGGLGPWCSSLRPAWHADHLVAAARSHVDALLVEFAGGAASQQRYSRAALRSLVVATQELARAGRPRPALGLLLPIEELTAVVGPGADLTQPITWDALYRMIRDFYEIVPPELRAQWTDNGRPSCLVGLTRPPRELRATNSFLAWCEQRFRADFGLDLLWVGSPSWGRRGVKLDALASLEASLAPSSDTTARIFTASVGPGFNDTRVAEVPRIRPRAGGTAYRGDVTRCLAEPTTWLLLGAWNGYRHGEALAATREYGDAAQQAARIAAMQLSAPEPGPWMAKLRGLHVPARLLVGGQAECPVAVFNAGLRAWAGDDDVQLGYHWYTAEPQPVRRPDGTPELGPDGQAQVTLQRLADGRRTSPVLVSDGPADVPTSLVIEPLDAAGQPLPPGRYRLRLDAIAGTKEVAEPVLDAAGKPQQDRQGRPVTRPRAVPRWFSDEGDPTFDVLVDVVAPEQAPAYAASLLASGLPARVATGQRYPLVVQMRNDGAQPWDAAVSLVARFERRRQVDPCTPETEAESLSEWVPLGGVLDALNRQAQAVAARVGAAAPAPVTQVAPGELVQVRAELPIVGADGQPLAIDEPGSTWRVRLALRRQNQVLELARPYFQGVEVVARDWGVTFGAIDVPEPVAGGQTITVTAGLANTGHRPWPAQRAAVAWHWYYWDGVELQYDAGRLPLPADVAPGTATQVVLPVRTPANPGPYYLVCELVQPDDVWPARQPATTLADLAVKPVLVVRGDTRPVELDDLRRVVGSALDTRRAQADFDGQGHAFPAEAVPPGADDLSEGLYPSGYLGPVGGAAPAWQRSIAFWYTGGQRQLLAFRTAGEQLRVIPGRYRRLHLLAAAVEGDVQVRLGLVPTPRATAQPRWLAPVGITAWDSPPRHGELIGLQVPYRRGTAEDEPRPCYLHHQVIDLPADQAIEGLLLPDEPRLRLVAVTLEPAAAVPVGPPAPPTASTR